MCDELYAVVCCHGQGVNWALCERKLRQREFVSRTIDSLTRIRSDSASPTLFSVCMRLCLAYVCVCACVCVFACVRVLLATAVCTLPGPGRVRRDRFIAMHVEIMRCLRPPIEFSVK